MSKLVIIGANDFQNQLILKAKSLGYETHVFAWEQGAVGKDNADYFYPISITEKDEILDICKKIKPVGVCSIASDLAAITVNYVAENLGLPCNKTQYVPIQTNKYKMRQALLNAGISCPKFAVTTKDFDANIISDFNFPIIVKPTDRSGSRCITKLNSLDGIEKAVNDACEVSFENKAIIEEYIDGNEYSMETITQNGVHHYLATTKKFTTGAPNFIETGHIQPCDLTDEVNNKALEQIKQALTALHIENSAGHSEFKVDNDGNIKIIEIGARMGGGCIGSDLVYLSTGHDFMKYVIDIAIGKDLELQLNPTNNKVEIKFLFTQIDIDEMYDFEKNFPEKIYRISPLELENIGKVTDCGTRIGYYIIYGGDSI